MSERKIHLRVLTPSKVALDSNIDFVILRTVEGDMGVLPGHEPYSAMLGAGLLRAFDGKAQTGLLAVLGGIVTVRDNRVTVLSGLAEHPDQVEEELERRRRERQENAGREQKSELEIRRAEMALRRALLGMDTVAPAIAEEPSGTSGQAGRPNGGGVRDEKE